jgi:hypothetical protein
VCVGQCLRSRQGLVRSARSSRESKSYLSSGLEVYSSTLVNYCGDLDLGCRETCCEGGVVWM